jgi:hypothetical protein
MWVVDIAKTGHEHSSFNSAVVAAVAQAVKPGAALRVFLAANHESIEQLPSGANVVAVNVRPLKPGGLNLQKYVAEMVRTLWLARRAQRAGEPLLYLSMSALAFWALALVCRWTRWPWTAIVHNEIESLVPDPAAGRSRRRSLLEQAFKWIVGSRANVICLSADGASLLSKRFPGLRVTYTMLPAQAAPHLLDPALLEPLTASSQRVVCVAGTMKDHRLQRHLLQLVKELEARLATLDMSLRLRVVGGQGLSDSTRQQLTGRRIDIEVTSPRAIDAYLEQLIQSDVMVFLPTPQMYRVSESSVLFDAASVGVKTFSLPCACAVQLARRCPALLVVAPDFKALTEALLDCLGRPRNLSSRQAFVSNEIGPTVVALGRQGQ